MSVIDTAIINATTRNLSIAKSPSLLAASREIAGAAAWTNSNVMRDCLGTAAELYATSTSATYADLVNYTGAGVLLFCAWAGDGTTSTAECTITIDGTVVLNAVLTGAGLRCAVGSVSGIDTTNSRANVSLESVPFRSSLRIQYRRVTAGTYQIAIAAKYRAV